MIIYLHGFNSSGESQKGQYLKRTLKSITVQTPSYSWQPRVAMAELETYIAKYTDNKLTLVGSSLGGFYAQYLARKYHHKLVLINPALDPVAILSSCVGENRNYYTHQNYMFSEQDLLSLQEFYVDNVCINPLATLLLVDADDELIDQNQSVEMYQDCAKVVVYPGGDHGFQHIREAAAEIEQFHHSQPKGIKPQ